MCWTVIRTPCPAHTDQLLSNNRTSTRTSSALVGSRRSSWAGCCLSSAPGASSSWAAAGRPCTASSTTGHMQAVASRSHTWHCPMSLSTTTWAANNCTEVTQAHTYHLRVPSQQGEVGIHHAWKYLMNMLNLVRLLPHNIMGKVRVNSLYVLKSHITVVFSVQKGVLNCFLPPGCFLRIFMSAELKMINCSRAPSSIWKQDRLLSRNSGLHSTSLYSFISVSPHWNLGKLKLCSKCPKTAAWSQTAQGGEHCTSEIHQCNR